MKIALGIEYDGFPWHGWQSQPDGCTVQDQLEAALSRFADEPVRVHCAGRTDTGVHALGQVVHLETEKLRENHAWVRGVNAHLPDSIAVRWALPVADDFHARFSATGRSYEYWLYNHPVRSALHVNRTGWTHTPLDTGRMAEAAQSLLGTHDFSAFRSSECQAKSPVRTLHQLDIARFGDLIRLRLSADAFLHHMVRNIVGTLIYIGSGRQPAAWAAEILESRNRIRAAPTFAAAGLYLTQVEYPRHFGIPSQAASPFVLS
ncbi:MAG: tRNA pseudouridine(38-40) synthase TruA [Burkholderiaceae bacterium]|nr:MAG: tRNA pseudouridine(38-40) synthase TruA [Burkholderiaceae bacterium]